MFKLRRKQAVILGYGLLIVLVVIGTGLPVLGLVRYSTTNTLLCGSCHREEYKQWLGSKSHKPEDAICTDCHAEKVSFAPEDFSVSRDRINSNCLKCHENILRQDKPEELKNHYLKISHKRCMSKTGYKCLNCHYNLIHDKVAPKSNRPFKVSCYQCHKKEIDTSPPKDTACKKCHYITLVSFP